MLGEDEIRHIFPDEEEEIQAGDIVSALWLPNGQFYDAKVLQKGGKFNFTAFISATRSQYFAFQRGPSLFHSFGAAGFSHLRKSNCRVQVLLNK